MNNFFSAASVAAGNTAALLTQKMGPNIPRLVV